MKAKKSLGQHFLKSEKALSEIIEAGSISGDDVILEIGPGTGILTEKLLEKAKRVFAVEKDRRAVSLLGEKFKKEIKEGRLILLEEDILNFDTEILKSFPYKIIANIPYYITGAIIRKFLSDEHQPESMILLVQKEVAERIVARDSKESILSISVKLFGTPKFISDVSAENFEPKPKVDSAIILIDKISKDRLAEIDEGNFFETVRQGFSHKRKTLLNNFKEPMKEKIKDYLNEKNLSAKARAEELTLEDWINLSKI